MSENISKKKTRELFLAVEFEIFQYFFTIFTLISSITKVCDFDRIQSNQPQAICDRLGRWNRDGVQYSTERRSHDEVRQESTERSLRDRLEQKEYDCGSGKGEDCVCF